MTPPDADGTGRYVVDRIVSRLTVRAFAGGLLSALGHSPTFAVLDYAGEVAFDPATPSSTLLTVTVRSKSLALVDDVSQSDRKTIEKTMHEEVLQSATHPEISFVSERVAVTPDPGSGRSLQASVRGKLTIRDHTEQVTIPARVSVTGNLLRASGEFEIRQTNFGIKPVMVGGSMLKVKDELTCTFDLVGKR